MKNLLLKTIKPLSLSITLALSSLTMQSLSAAEFTAPQALFPDNQGSIAPQLNFTQSETSDIYIAIKVNGEGPLYFVTKDQGISTAVLPYDSIASYSGIYELPAYDTLNLPAAQFQFYQITVIAGTSALNIENWIGGVNGLNALNFSVSQVQTIDGDWDNDGWSDDDLNHDGFHDDDVNLDGYHDDDLNKDGYHDDDLDKDGFHDQDNSVTRGEATYGKECASSSCHGLNPLNNQEGILGARSAAATDSAIVRNKGGMAYLNYLTSTDLQDIADYINSL
ncbi:MAG: cytochrome c [Pseudomonadota bacterium]